MCLYVNKAETDRLLEKFGGTGSWIQCWKVFTATDTEIMSPYQGTVHNLMTNEIRANIQHNHLSKYIKVYKGFMSGVKTEVVEEGIHAYLKKIRGICSNRIQVRCWGHIDDLIAVGNGDVAFRKLYIDEKAYEKLLAKFKPEYEAY